MVLLVSGFLPLGFLAQPRHDCDFQRLKQPRL
jgi:hypothetical protein